MVRADGHFPGSHGARKPLMPSKEGSGSWRSSWVGRCLYQVHGGSSLAGGQGGGKTSGSSSGSSMEPSGGTRTLPSYILAWESL
jgi:hypothetical protein